MHFINNSIGRRSQSRSLILCPTFRIGCLHVNDSSTFSIHPYRFRIDARSISQPFILDFHIKCIEFPYQVFFHLCRPSSFLIRYHGNSLISMAAITCIKQHEAYFISSRRPQCKIRNFGSILHFRQTTRTNGIQLIRRVLILCRSTADNCRCGYSNQGKFIQFHGGYFKF